jgi:hypothetical protein
MHITRSLLRRPGLPQMIIAMLPYCSANEMIFDPAATATYCLPSTA